MLASTKAVVGHGREDICTNLASPLYMPWYLDHDYLDEICQLHDDKHIKRGSNNTNSDVIKV